MTCESALEMMLDVEPWEFSANEATPLGDHLRGCVRCRGVAAQLMHDTQRLAVAMAVTASGRRPAGRAVQVSLAPAFVVAALAFAVLLRSRPAGTPVVLESSPADHSVPAPVALPESVPNVDAAPARTADVRPLARRAFARAVPVAPVRLEPSGAAPATRSVKSSDVTVTPPPGTRATVMHTSNPKLVVVWLH